MYELIQVAAKHNLDLVGNVGRDMFANKGAYSAKSQIYVFRNNFLGVIISLVCNDNFTVRNSKYIH
jgi:hypothetical protein